ncbi:TetR/AcrR family transcriptional regulator [Lampropedia aestuarii]|uniref:TetR/AcrR family transcriptional regulator n=1 Tax=Lampropedia aestuarii TaxID=2562762 RepID=A0A4S5BFM8_9BURK|nr:TetR/AcrR family transcriptional regulator [Lampropedia aestuarii]THJ31137.1 TetR/AcrR family transcriptional regulator [Lampropedia aestuarii]
MPKAKENHKESAHHRLLHAAADLFYSDGIAGTGIDAIVKKAGVAKKSLYNNFESKSDLVAQYLSVRHAEWIALYQARAAKAASPLARVMAVFEAYADHAELEYDGGFRGCGLLNAAAELPATGTERQAIRAHKEEVEAIVYQHLLEYQPNQAARMQMMARHLAFLLEGSISRAGLEGCSDCVKEAQAMAQTLLEAA